MLSTVDPFLQKEIFHSIPLNLRICWKLFIFGDTYLKDSLKLKHSLQDLYMSAKNSSFKQFKNYEFEKKNAKVSRLIHLLFLQELILCIIRRPYT